MCAIAWPACRDSGGAADPGATRAEPPGDLGDDSTGDAGDTRGAGRELGRPVFRLGDNRLLAHQRRAGALYIDAGSAGLAKYLRFGVPTLGWTPGERRDGVRVALADSLASLEIPLTEHRAGTSDVLELRIHTPRPRRLTVKLNGRAPSDERGASTVDLEPGWQTATIPVATGRFVAGENFIALSFGRARRGQSSGRPGRQERGARRRSGRVGSSDRSPALAWLRIGARARLAEPAPGPIPYDADRDAFTLGEGDGLTYYVYIPETGRLVADVQPASGSAGEPASGSAGEPASGSADGPGSGSGCRVAVRARAPGIDFTGALEGRRAAVELGSFAGRVVRLDLDAAGCSRAELARARITIAGHPVEPYTGPPPRYIVLWVMDTLRADRVRPFEPGARPEVPNLDRLAMTGTVFRQFWVQGNESQTSHASIWTALYPKVHTVRTAGNVKNSTPPRRYAMLGQVLADRGFQTIGVTANGYVHHSGRYSEGFEVWRNLMREGLHERHSVPSEKIYDMAIEYMRERYASGPVLLFIGTIDTHKPWVARQPWIDRYDTEPYDGEHDEAVWPSNLGMVAGSMRCKGRPPPRELARINAIYDSNVSYQDAQVGRLYAQLVDWGIADQTMIVITADHGEELYEHDRCGHGFSLREIVVRVPLLIHYPPLFPGDRVVVGGAEGVDILPTILAALGEPPLDDAQGRSLIPVAQGVGRGYPDPSYASQYEYAHAMRLAQWKLRVGRPTGMELYNLADDPEERDNLAGQRPIARRFMTDPLSLFLVYRHRWKKRYLGTAANMTARAARILDGDEPEAPATDRAEGGLAGPEAPGAHDLPDAPDAPEDRDPADDTDDAELQTRGG